MKLEYKNIIGAIVRISEPPSTVAIDDIKEEFIINGVYFNILPDGKIIPVFSLEGKEGFLFPARCLTFIKTCQ